MAKDPSNSMFPLLRITSKLHWNALNKIYLFYSKRW